MYALSANYGGLIARMLFQPIEISSRNLFANLCSTTPSPSKQTNDQSPPTKTTPPANTNFHTALQTITTLLRIYTLLSLPVLVLGPPAAPLLLRLIAGSRWSESGAGHVLGTYCYYIPFLALNGVSEAFVAATASTKDLRNQSFWMGANFVVFASSAWVLLRSLDWGAEGLVVANCVNMGMRIGFNLWYIVGFFQNRGLVCCYLCDPIQRGSDTVRQNFDVKAILPSAYAVAASAVMPAIISQARHAAPFLDRFGVLGELARIVALAVPFTIFV